MNPARSEAREVRSALFIGAVLLTSGCTEELGPVTMPVTRVQGIITEGRRPISGGWIEFMPVDGTVGNLRSARIRNDGKFDADGVAIGQNAIRLINAPIETPADQQLFSSNLSPIRRKIEADPSAPLRIDLVEEVSRFRVQRSRQMSRTMPTTGEGP